MLEDSKPIHNSKPPLRWIANWAGEIASKGILKVSYMEEDAYTGWRYKLNLFLWDTFWPIYDKWGTVYIWNLDTDEYWERTGTVDPDYEMNLPDYNYDEFHWDYIDEETGDAFKVINFGGKE